MKKSEVLPFAASWMGLWNIMLSEISHKVLYVITHRWTLKNKTNDCIYNKTDRLTDNREQTSGYQWRERSRGEARWGMRLKETAMYKIGKQPRYIFQCREI